MTFVEILSDFWEGCGHLIVDTGSLVCPTNK